VVTHPTTNLPARGLSTAERTGSPVFHVLWSIAKNVDKKTLIFFQNDVLGREKLGSIITEGAAVGFAIQSIWSVLARKGYIPLSLG
jgi:hypothetical protein